MSLEFLIPGECTLIKGGDRAVNGGRTVLVISHERHVTVQIEDIRPSRNVVEAGGSRRYVIHHTAYSRTHWPPIDRSRLLQCRALSRNIPPTPLQRRARQKSRRLQNSHFFVFASERSERGNLLSDNDLAKQDCRVALPPLAGPLLAKTETWLFCNHRLNICNPTSRALL